MNSQAKYFLIAVVFFGSIGIWLPVAIEALVNNKITFHNIPPNVTTYFVSILFAGCIDYFLSKIRELNINGITSVFFNLIFLSIVGIGLAVGAVICNINNKDLLSLLLGIIGLIIAYRIWWLANVNNPNFISNTAPLGGDASRPLSN